MTTETTTVADELTAMRRIVAAAQDRVVRWLTDRFGQPKESDDVSDLTHHSEWQPGDPLDRHGGAPELYCACGARVAGYSLEPGPCPECGQRLSFDPTACLDWWRAERDALSRERDSMRPVVEAARALIAARDSVPWVLAVEEVSWTDLRAKLAAVDALDGAS